MLSWKNIIWFLITLAVVYFSYLMLLITLQYIPYSIDAAFLALKTEEVKIPYYRVAFYTHVYSSIIILLLGFVQFAAPIRIQYPQVHRNMGKSYIILVLLLASPTGFIMGIHGNGGIYAQTSFCIQAILWFIFTWKAFVAIKRGKVHVHLYYMILSFAMTLSAISLRLFKWIIVTTLALPPMDTYKIVVWLGWIFNILVALIIIRFHQIKANKANFT